MVDIRDLKTLTDNYAIGVERGAIMLGEAVRKVFAEIQLHWVNDTLTDQQKQWLSNIEQYAVKRFVKAAGERDKHA